MKKKKEDREKKNRREKKMGRRGRWACGWGKKKKERREDPDRGKEEKNGEKEIGCNVSSWSWLKEDNEIFS